MALTFPGGISLYERKNKLNTKPEIASVPQFLKYRIRDGFKQLVYIGDFVRINSPIMSDENGFECYSTVSGIVADITDEYIIIENDEKYTSVFLFDKIERSAKEITYEELLEYIKLSGIIGAFSGKPLYEKLQRSYEKVKRLIINCVESDPCSGNVRLFASENPEDIIFGAKLVMIAMGIPKAVIAFCEKDVKIAEAFDKILAKNDMIVSAFVSDKYPQGVDRLLVTSIYNLEVPLSRTTEDCGYLVISAETLYNVYNCLKDRSTVINKTFSFTGEGIKKTLNITARIGTPLDAIMDEFGINKAVTLISGGVLSGRPDCPECIEADTNIITATSGNKSAQSDCIHCARCISVCPMYLPVYRFIENFESHRHDLNEDIGLYNCIECGCCSYVCPSNIDLLGLIRADKAEEVFNDIKTEVFESEIETEEIQNGSTIEEEPLPDIDDTDKNDGENNFSGNDFQEETPPDDLISITDISSISESKKRASNLDDDLSEALGDILSDNDSEKESTHDGE